MILQFLGYMYLGDFVTVIGQFLKCLIHISYTGSLIDNLEPKILDLENTLFDIYIITWLFIDNL